MSYDTHSNKVDKDALNYYIRRAFKGKCRCWGYKPFTPAAIASNFSMNSECGMFYSRKVLETKR